MSLKKEIQKIKHKLEKFYYKKFLMNNETLYKKWFYDTYVVPYNKSSREEYIRRTWNELMKTDLNLDNPKTLNEKLQWIKMFVHDDFRTLCADKYAVREYISKTFGNEYLIPLLYQTYKWKDITYKNIPDEPCVLKPNHGSGWYKIIRNKDEIDFKELQLECMRWLNQNYYYLSMEEQYKDIKPCLIVEKLLTTKSGKIPNDYKLVFINGNFEYVYCSIDREGENYRNIYDKDWKLLPFTWGSHGNGTDIAQPKRFKQMIEMGKEVAKNFNFVRVDFFDVDGKIYCGEITFEPGSGFDKFNPPSYDEYFGDKLKL